MFSIWPNYYKYQSQMQTWSVAVGSTKKLYTPSRQHAVMELQWKDKACNHLSHFEANPGETKPKSELPISNVWTMDIHVQTFIASSSMLMALLNFRFTHFYNTKKEWKLASEFHLKNISKINGPPRLNLHNNHRKNHSSRKWTGPNNNVN
jgi:hypothetical protein